MTTDFHRFLAFCAILLLAAIPRAVHLAADPPTNISWSGDLLTDEGWYSHNAREKTLRGRWFDPRLRNSLSHFPLASLAQRAVFSQLGVGLGPLRLLSIAATLIGFLAFYLWLRHKRGALLALFLLSISYYCTSFQRLGLIEPLLAAALLVVCATAGAARQRASPLLACLAGLLSAASLLGIKSTGAIIIPPLIVFFSLPSHHSTSIPASPRTRRYIISCYAAGLVIITVLWATLWLPVCYADWLDFSLGVRQTQPLSLNPLHLLRNIANLFGDVNIQRNLFPCLWLGEYFGLKILFSAVNRKDATAPPEDLLMALWLWLGLSFFGLLPYHPPRYLLILAAPLFYLVGRCLSRSDGASSSERSASMAAFYSVCGLNLVGIAHSAFEKYFSAFLAGPRLASVAEILVEVAILGSFFLAFGPASKLEFGAFLRWLEGGGPQRRSTLARGFIAFVVLWNAWLYGRSLATTQWSMTEAAKRVAQVVQNDCPQPVIIGSVADTLALTHHLPSCNFSDYERHRPEILTYYRPTHLVTLSIAELQECQSAFPEYFQEAEMILSTPLMGNYYTGEPLRLYRLHPGPTRQ